ncbi:unnamed protein product, partial [Polarella glacialis]
AVEAIECELLGEWGSFSWWLQVFLASACLVSLVGKRFTDRVRRPWKVWFFDMAKQGVQAFMTHLLNIVLSTGFVEWLDSDADPCNWYWINMSLDCTLGVGIIFFLLRSLQFTYRMKFVGRPELARCGHYGDPPEFRIFARQLLDWQALTIFEYRCALDTNNCFHTQAITYSFGSPFRSNRCVSRRVPQPRRDLLRQPSGYDYTWLSCLLCYCKIPWGALRCGGMHNP